MNSNRHKVSEESILQKLQEAEVQEHIFWNKELVVSYKLKNNNFTICGRAACIDEKNFSLEIGRKIAFEDAKKQLWAFEGYLLADSLSKIEQRDAIIERSSTAGDQLF